MRAQVVCLLLALLSLAGCEDVSVTYTGRADAEADGAFRKGWLPSWLPEDVELIHERHNLDTQIRAISFKLNTANEFEWPAICRPISTAPAPRLKTIAFPRHVERAPGLQDCDGLYGILEEGGWVHLWGRG